MHCRRTACLILAILMSLLLAACVQGDTPPSTSQTPAETEYSLPKEEGYNQITFYFSYPKELKNADVWVWWDGKDGQGYILHPCAYGAKAVVNVPEGISQVGFIVRRDCSDPGGSSWGSATKDYEADRFAILTGKETVIYLKTADPAQYTSHDGGKTLENIRKFNMANIADFHTISYSIAPAATITSYDQIKVYEGGKELAITAVDSLGKETGKGNITLKDALDLGKTYEVEIDGYGKVTALPISIFDSEEFVSQYTYDGDDLGAVIHGNDTTFKVWAPTASKVVLNLFEAGNDCEAFASVQMQSAGRGVWELTQKDIGHGTYYTYTVTTAVGTQEATDPYAKAAGVNGDRSMVVDLSKTNPDGWGKPFDSGIKTYSEASIWEIHVRDFSNKISQSQYSGKYLAFTERGLTNEAGIPVGVDYLVNLGVSHIHLLPVYDYATVDETKLDTPQFNWGYDPKNYNVPEGSYATDPYHGEVRITEYKQMVQGLHDAGLGVVMDVVYNHTYDGNSAFNKIVPYYYYRYTPSGANTSASGCGNDTASERYMFRKFMVDSVRYWASEYCLDGFRFDLMGLHDLETMRQIEKAVHEVNPQALIYGEGWTMGATVDGSDQANQSNISKIEPSKGAAGSVAVFNDAIRDGLKGSTFDTLSQGYISGAYGANESKVQFGISGSDLIVTGWTVKNEMSINYMSAHDNHTLWDKLEISNPNDSVETRIKMNKLGAGIIMVSQGTPFMQAGEEMLRSKGGDENSYKSSDAVNNIDWEALTETSDQYKVMQYYKGLLAMRKAHPILGTDGKVEISFDRFAAGGMVVNYLSSDGKKALVLINPTPQAFPYTLEGNWMLLADGEQAGAKPLAEETGSVTVDGYTLRVYVEK